jgi:hypothetical protein
MQPNEFSATCGICLPRPIRFDTFDGMNSKLFSFVLFSWLATTAGAPVNEKLTPASFAYLHALISPHPGEEKWLQINWLTNLTEARRQAEAQNKPILLWEMDGNPLGCT